MERKIIQETEFVTICEGGFGPVVPYGPVEHEDGDRNHGYVDTKANPDLISSIPEVAGWPQFQQLLEVINKHTPLRSLGCEKGYFPVEQDNEAGLKTYVGSYVETIVSP